jgi:hypothetical protein
LITDTAIQSKRKPLRPSIDLPLPLSLPLASFALASFAFAPSFPIAPAIEQEPLQAVGIIFIVRWLALAVVNFVGGVSRTCAHAPLLASSKGAPNSWTRPAARKNIGERLAD